MTPRRRGVAGQCLPGILELFVIGLYTFYVLFDHIWKVNSIIIPGSSSPDLLLIADRNYCIRHEAGRFRHEAGWLTTDITRFNLIEKMGHIRHNRKRKINSGDHLLVENKFIVQGTTTVSPLHCSIVHRYTHVVPFSHEVHT